ncbi:alpha/beta hydrolase [Rhodococcus sp. SC4]|nr:alpha/beta hydrolase [Rhodococcus sp. SC4]
MTQKAASKFSRRTVEFRSGDSFCSAWLYLPGTDSEAPVPVVVMGHGLGATREMGLAPYAERFVAAGLAVLVFTYRNLGDSGGAPRQMLSMTKQLADWDAALEYAAGLPEVDRHRVAVWGSSLGGGHAISVAARHPELRAAVAQCPFTDGLASAGGLGLRETLVLLGYVARDLLAAARRKEPVTVPVAAQPGKLALMNAPDALPGMQALLPAGYQWVNHAAARSVTSLIRYRPGRSAKRIAAPILVCISATDSVAPPAQTERYARQAPHGDVRLYDAGHFDFYLGAAFEQLATDQTEFLVSHLKPARVAGKAR